MFTLLERTVYYVFAHFQSNVPEVKNQAPTTQLSLCSSAFNPHSTLCITPTLLTASIPCISLTIHRERFHFSSSDLSTEWFCVCVHGRGLTRVGGLAQTKDNGRWCLYLPHIQHTHTHLTLNTHGEGWAHWVYIMHGSYHTNTHTHLETSAKASPQSPQSMAKLYI